MALTVSPAIRIVSLLGLLLALGAGGAMHFMGGGSGSATAVVPSQNSAVLRAKAVAARASARAKNPTAATPATHKITHKTVAAKPKASAAAVPAKAPAKPAPTATKVSPALAAGLPLSLAQALAVNPTVVAVIYNPQAEVDGIAFAEARAGAALPPREACRTSERAAAGSSRAMARSAPGSFESGTTMPPRSSSSR